MKSVIMGSLVFFTGLISSAAPFVVFADSSSELQIIDLASGQKRDTRAKVSGEIQISKNYAVFLDSSGDLQIVNLSTGEKRDTRQKVNGSFKISPE